MILITHEHHATPLSEAEDLTLSRRLEQKSEPSLDFVVGLAKSFQQEMEEWSEVRMLTSYKRQIRKIFKAF